MFRRVLFPTVFSSHARRTLECIAGLPGIEEVILLHVAELPGRGVDRWAEESILKNSRMNLAEERAYLEAKGLKAHCIIRTLKKGAVGGVIIETAAAEGVSAIVMGAGEKSRVHGMLLGTTSQYVLRHTRVHLLIMRHEVIELMTRERFEKYCPRIFSHVLCPTDFSTFADSAIDKIGSFPGTEQMLLLHVVAMGSTENEAGEAESQLETTVAGLIRQGVSARFMIRTGEPAAEINRAAEEEDCSLIALSSYGKGWFADLLLGSTAAEIARTADRPVFILRNSQTGNAPV